MKYYHVLLLVLIVALSVSHYSGYTPIALGVFFLLAGVITYALYAKDKAAAMVGSWRVSENTLHIAALLFGWPGALIAQKRLRHKTKKQSFRIFFWMTVLINLGCVAWLHGPQGNLQLREGVYKLENFAISTVPYAAPVSTVLFLTKFRAKDVEWFR